MAESNVLPTAGEVLPSNVNNSSVDADAVHKDGIEHIKANTFGTAPPASNPGAEDATGGIATGRGGVSSTSQIESPVENEESKTIVGSTVDSIKTFLWGSGTPEKEAQVAEHEQGGAATGTSTIPATGGVTTEDASKTASGYASTAGAVAAGLGASAAATAASLTGSKYPADTAESLEETKKSQEAAAGVSTGTGLSEQGTATSVSRDVDTTTTTTGTTGSNEDAAASGSYINTVGATAAGLGASAAANATNLTGSQYAADTANSLDQTRKDQEAVAGTSTGTGLTAPVSANQTITSSAATPEVSAPPENSSSAAHTSPAVSPPDIKDTTMSDTTDTTDTPPQAAGVASADRGIEDAETTTGADKQTEATTDAGQAGAGPGDVGESNKPPAAAGGHSGKIENKSAIPTAGGERLGEKHWGESDVVPDNPKPKTEAAGIASKDGQPTDQVKDNTAKNTGGATGGPGAVASSPAGETQEKERLVDKIKDKLHIGKKDKS